MELRVHGIGGTTAQSMLGRPPDAVLVPRYPRGRGAVPHVWRASDPEVAAYHWAPLTSGSRWFVLWPLALPFTLLNVAGFMHPGGRTGSALRLLHRLACVVVTAWFATWLVFGGLVVSDAKGWNRLIGLSAALAIAVVVVAPSWWRCRWDDGAAPAVAGRRGLADPAFFHVGRRLWVLHVVVLVATAGAVGLRGWAGDGDGALVRAAGDSVVDVGMALVALLAVMLVLTVCARSGRAWAWALAAVGASGLGAALVGGLAIALLRVVVGEDLRGTPFVVFDVYGFAALAALGSGAAVTVWTLGRRSPGERLGGDLAERVLPDPMSWLRARIAQLPRAVGVAIGAAVITFVVVGSVLFVVRAPATVAEWQDRLWPGDGADLPLLPSPEADDAADEAAWRLTTTPPVRIAHLLIYGVFLVMFVNLARSYGSSDHLRRVGSVWDVLTFWPRHHHPFAVRPYTECAVDQLRELLFCEVDDDWTPLTVVAHSQGSMLVVAALAPGVAPGGQSRRSRVAHLLTVGSPLRSLYMRAFPAYVGQATIDAAVSALADDARWTNVFRYTDHVGRTVFADDKGWDPTTAQAEGWTAGAAGDRWWVEAVDDAADGGCRRRDCVVADPAARQDGVRGHNDYWTDERVRAEVTSPWPPIETEATNDGR